MQEKRIVINSKVKDSSSKQIFDEPILVAQFVPLFAEERNADRVKKIRIKDEVPFYMVSLIEHKTDIDYNVCMQIFRYIVYIWDAYEKEMEQIQSGISKLKDFKYYLVPVHDYTNEELLEKSDEISLVMLFNKLQTKEDVEEFRRISPQRLEEILKETPPHLLNIMANVLLAFLLKENVPVEEAENLAGKVKEKKMAELFANMEHMDIQAERRNTEEQRLRADRAEERADKVKQALETEKRRYNESIKLYIENCQEFSMPKEQIVERLKEKFGFDGVEAQEKVGSYKF